MPYRPSAQYPTYASWLNSAAGQAEATPTQTANGGGDPGWSGQGGSAAAGYTAAANAYRNSYNAGLPAAGAGAAGASTPGPNDRINNAYNQQFALTQGRGDALNNDPYTLEALRRLQAQTESGPLGTTEVNQIAANNAEGTAASAGSQADMARSAVEASGGNINDPAFQERLRQIDQGRQSTNSSMLGNLQTQAAQTNYSAMGSAAQALAGVRGAQNSQINQMYSQAAQLYNQQSANGPHQTAVSTSGGGAGGGFQYNPSSGGSAGSNGDPYGHTATPTYGPVSAPTGVGNVPRQPAGGSGESPWNTGGYNESEGTVDPTQQGGSEAAAAYQANGGLEGGGFEYNPQPSNVPYQGAYTGSYGANQEEQNYSGPTWGAGNTPENTPEMAQDRGLVARSAARPAKFQYRPTGSQPRY